MGKKRNEQAIFWGVIIISLVFLSGSYIASANIFDFFRGITGMVPSETTSINVTIGNSEPRITYVSTPGSQSITENGTTKVYISFIANDTDGASNLANTTASIQFNLTGANTRANLTCVAGQRLSSETINYSCAVPLWYWDSNGGWTINATIRDSANALATNDSTILTVGQTAGMQMSPKALTWSSLAPTSTNSLANQYITINNTANKNITTGNVKVTAVSLRGETTITDFLLAGNFSVNTANACEGTVMVNNTATGVSGAVVPAGNLTAGANAQEAIYFCLEDVTAGINQQSYSTAVSGAWTIAVS